ncbi:MAG: hypothetical protein AseanaTS_27100 [Candidatus Pelagadaptatus aseana]
MMSIRELVKVWGQLPEREGTIKQLTVDLSVTDSAKLKALCDLFPQRREQDIVTDLLSVALDEVAAVFPYQAGTQVTGHDEEGNPLYEDVGMTARYLELTKKYQQQFAKNHN